MPSIIIEPSGLNFIDGVGSVGPGKGAFVGAIGGTVSGILVALGQIYGRGVDITGSAVEVLIFLGVLLFILFHHL